MQRQLCKVGNSASICSTWLHDLLWVERQDWGRSWQPRWMRSLFIFWLVWCCKFLLFSVNLAAMRLLTCTCHAAGNDQTMRYLQCFRRENLLPSDCILVSLLRPLSHFVSDFFFATVHMPLAEMSWGIRSKVSDWTCASFEFWADFSVSTQWRLRSWCVVCLSWTQVSTQGWVLGGYKPARP